MAWNDELTRAFGTRCSECGQAFEEGDDTRELGFSHAMHEACYAKVLEDIERGVLGHSDEHTESRESERKQFLDRVEDEKRRALALDRNEAIWGQETAKGLDRVATWMMKHKTKKSSKS